MCPKILTLFASVLKLIIEFKRICLLHAHLQNVTMKIINAREQRSSRMSDALNRVLRLDSVPLQIQHIVINLFNFCQLLLAVRLSERSGLT